MKTVNFSIEKDFISLRFDGGIIDLHNNYDFTHFTHDEINNRAECTFVKNDGDWVPENALKSLAIRFTMVTAVFYKTHDPEYPGDYIKNDERTVDQIGYSYATGEIMEGVTDYESSNEWPALLITFVTGKAIKVVADSAELVVA